MTAALAQTHPGVEVAGVEVLLRDDGTNRRARLGLTYARGTGPKTVFLKASDPEHAKLNARSGGVFDEPMLFESGVRLPIEHPAVYVALIDEPNLDFLLVMEDVTGRDGIPRDATRPLTVDEAADGVAGLARLHSAFWADRLEATGALAWVRPYSVWFSMARGVDAGIARAGDRLAAEITRLGGEAIDRSWQRYIATLAHGPSTLLHGDAHIGNTYTLPGNRVGYLDWQVVRRGDYGLDLGYFLQGALTIEDRRASEADLVDHYLKSLTLPKDEQPSLDAAWLRYRASVAHGLTIWLATSASNWQLPEVSLTLAERYATAFIDLDAPQAIDQLSAQ
jgi:aminoglycoside phosphotransferase (APT) family kinase protein